MSDPDRTPTPGRPSAHKAQGRAAVPERRDLGEVADPATVRSAATVGTPSGSAGSASRRAVDPIRPNVPALPNPGERVGDFGLEEAIGAGGMGAVFRAIDIKLDRQVALKILPPDQAIDPEVVQRYYQEGRAAARLDHENIARVFSIGHDGQYHYIAFEYIEGTTIRQRVEAGGPLPVGDTINYTLQIANALVHSSSRGVVHRDIKPSNIIVTPQGRAKLVDMGLARRFERGEDTGLTQSGMTLGTFDYISPEQARDPRDVDVRGDLYSLGCTLFHMLSGRPPFPEGTVLQKLLQHQEETPPDIRKLNPSVPDDLSSILVKLMAKDRDRRYQTPEQLVRDLLTVAGSLGLRSLNPEGLVWMAPVSRRAPAWTRQLVWGVPALAFVIIVSGMALWGEGPAWPVPSVGDPVSTGAPAKPRPVDPQAPLKSQVVAVPREFAVDSRDDLLRFLAEAPPKSTILLTDPGPYDLRGARSRLLTGLDLTIRAEAGVHPIIRLVRDPEGVEGSGSFSLLDLVGSRLTLEGLDFLVEGDNTLAAIRAEDSELIVRRCVFRRTGTSTSRSKPAAIAFKTSAKSSQGSLADRSGTLTVEASEFDGGQVAVLATGPVEVSLRDCTFGPVPADRATIWAENLLPGARAAEFLAVHISVLAGAGPVFRFAGIAPKVRVTESAFAPPTLASVSPTLVAIDASDRLDWRGIDNVYGKFGTYLMSLKGTNPRTSIKSFEGWADDPAAVREWGSSAFEGQLWEERNPLDALVPGSVRSGRAFQLALSRQAPSRPGARQGPGGPLLAPILQSDTPLPPSAAAATEVPLLVELEPGRRRPQSAGEPGRPREIVSLPTTPKLAAVDPDDSMKAMPLNLPGEKQSRDADSDGPTGAADLTPMPMPVDPERPTVAPLTAPPALTPVGPPKPVALAPTLPTSDPIVIRSPEEFREALSRPGPGTRTLIVAADADWSLPACRVRGMANWVIRAEHGASRPRIRFRSEVLTVPMAVEAWSAWMTVQASGLRMEGIDLILLAPEAESLMTIPLPARKRAAFAVAPGTIDLTLVDCTVTIEGDASPSAVVAVLPGDLGGEGRVRIKNCLLRAGGDLVDVAGGRRLELEVDNAVIATGGSMLHAHGLPEGRAPEELKLVLRQVSARMLGGLVQLQSTGGEPELPVTSINARDAVLSTGDPDAPLVRVDGQGNLDDLRALIHWEGRSVAYHQINIYRRDQTAQPGGVPILYDRDFWNFTLGMHEEAPIHGDLKFPYDWPPARRPWALRRDDLRLPSGSPATGSDLAEIPDPAASQSQQ